MQTIKKILIHSFWGLSCLFSGTLYAEAYDDIDDIMGGITPLAAPAAPLPGSGCINAIDILQLITPEFGQNCCNPSGGGGGCIINLPAILQESLYLSTVGPVSRRSLLDEPSLRNYVLEDCMIHLTFQPFYNYTPRVLFTDNSPYICSYLFPNSNIINQINSALAMGGIANVDIPAFLSLVQNFKLQQHRVGMMVGIGSKVGGLNLSFRIPVYYIIEHFFLTPSEIAAIDDFVINVFNRPDLTSQGNGNDFGEQHLVGDRLGFGDMRINALFNVFEDCRDHWWFGVQMTVPTATTFIAGLIGNKFSVCQPSAPFNIKQLFELFICADNDIEQRGAISTIQQIVTTFGIGAIDRLKTILFNEPLGNGGHFGIGPQVDFVHELSENWSVQTYAAFEGFSKHKEDRFFEVKKTPQEFNRNWRDEANAEENLSFLNQQIIDTVYPTHVRVDVRPGYLGKYAASLVCESLNWHGFIGFDYWYREAEKLYVNEQILAQYDVGKATRVAAHQGKFFFSFGYRNLYHCDRVFFDAEFAGDISLFSKGIGKDYTLGFRLSLDI